MQNDSTAPKQPKRGLGKGLSALFGEDYPSSRFATDLKKGNDSHDVRFLSLAQIHPDKNQPRTYFNEEKIDELALSVKQHGVLQPIVVHEEGANNYIIIAGERRFRAAKKAGLEKIPAVIFRNLNNKKKFELALLENIQRQDLTPIEEAKAYQTLIDKHNYIHEELAEIVNKSRSHVSNIMRLLKLPQEILTMVEKGELSVGHAKILLNNQNAKRWAKMVLEKDLSVRHLENLIKEEEGKVVLQKSKAVPDKSLSQPSNVEESIISNKSEEDYTLKNENIIEQNAAPQSITQESIEESAFIEQEENDIDSPEALVNQNYNKKIYPQAIYTPVKDTGIDNSALTMIARGGDSGFKRTEVDKSRLLPDELNQIARQLSQAFPALKPSIGLALGAVNLSFSCTDIEELKSLVDLLLLPQEIN